MEFILKTTLYVILFVATAFATNFFMPDVFNAWVFCIGTIFGCIFGPLIKLEVKA